MTTITNQFICALPKSDVHTHLDGSMRLTTLIELAKKQGVTLPSYTPEGLRELVFKPAYQNLKEYLTGFHYTVQVLRECEAVEQVAFELAEDAQQEGIRYLEVRFAPQLLASSGKETVQALLAVDQGLRRAASNHNNTPAVKNGNDTPFVYAIICCAMRTFSRGMSGYYGSLFNLMPNMPSRDLASLASLEAVRCAVTARDQHGVAVTGFDLAGEEAGYPAGHHIAAYQEAHRHFIRKTVHAGEAYGPESIYEAIAKCHAERIGHGTFLFAANRIKNNAIKDRNRFVNQLTDYIASMRVTIEVCPTSNLQTIPDLGNSMANHPVHQMLACGMSVAIATDNTLVSHTNINRELQLVAEACQLNLAQFKQLVLAGFKCGFFPDNYQAKRKYVRTVAKRINQVASEFHQGEQV